MSAVTVTRAGAADAAALSRLNDDVQALHAAAMPLRFKPPAADTFPVAAVLALIGQPETLFFLAHIDGLPVGYLYADILRRPESPIQYAAASIYINHISVRPDHHGRGVGTALLAAVEAAARAQGITRLGLDVWAFNERARSFFQRRGFAVSREVLVREIEGS